MATIDRFNAQETIDTLRRDCERDLSSAAAVVRQEWLQFDNQQMVYIHCVHTHKLTILTIGVPLPETPPAVTDSFIEAQHILEEYYARSHAT